MMRAYVSGQWLTKSENIEVLNPYDGSVIDTVPRCSPEDVDKVLESAVRGAGAMTKLSGYERYEILKRTAAMLEEKADVFARTITLEEGKSLAESKREVSRAIQTLTLSAEEAKRLQGETLPLDGAPHTTGKLGFTLRVPCGVVVAITPFNYPLNLVCHKVGPAIAGGNAVVVKPPSDTPLSALRLTETLLEAGLPSEGIQCLTGPGGELGKALCSDARVRKITFTGSRDVGERICQVAGLKKVTMELGSNSPIIVMPDADMDRVAEAVAATGYANAGQVCISAQRILVASSAYADFLDATRPKVEALKTGNPLEESTDVGPMIREEDALRVEEWINEAVADGASVLTGGKRTRAVYTPTIVVDAKPEMRVSCDELFGPAVAVTKVNDIEEAIAYANHTNYGLSAGIFTRNVDWAMKFARQVESGNLHINWGPAWRVDLMPYGGLKESGFGKEGPRYAVEEMTESKTVVFHLAN